MIYSRWRPDFGGYDYFEAGPEYNLNDDLPTPELDVIGDVGAPSVEAGRPIPAGARYVGEGDLAVGLVAPTDPDKLVRRTSLGSAAAGWFGRLPWAGILIASAIGYGIWWLAGEPTAE